MEELRTEEPHPWGLVEMLRRLKERRQKRRNVARLAGAWATIAETEAPQAYPEADYQVL